MSAGPSTRATRRVRVDLAVLLFLTPLLWGVTFPAGKRALETLPLLPFMAWSRVLGFATILVALPWIARGELTRTALRRSGPSGLALGVVMFLGYALQTAGIERTTATNAGFITGLYVVIVPLIELALFRRRAPAAAWGAVGLAIVGLTLLAVPGLRELRPHAGDLLVLAGAVAWAAHIALLGRFAERHPANALSLLQMAAAAALHLVACVGTGLQPARALDVWPLLLLTGVLGSGVAFTIQAVAQAEVSPARAAIILAGESLVSAFAAAVWLGERMDLQRWVGAALILVAMLVSELVARRSALPRIDPAVP